MKKYFFKSVFLIAKTFLFFSIGCIEHRNKLDYSHLFLTQNENKAEAERLLKRAQQAAESAKNAKGFYDNILASINRNEGVNQEDIQGLELWTIKAEDHFNNALVKISELE